MKQTAVEWLSRQISEIIDTTPLSQKQEEKLINTINKALEMEQEQSIDFACEVYNSHYYRDTRSFKQVSEEHYIQTYKIQQNG